MILDVKNFSDHAVLGYLSDEETNDEEGMDDDFSHLCDLAESAHLVDVYHTDADIIPLLEDFTLQETSTRNNSP